MRSKHRIGVCFTLATVAMAGLGAARLMPAEAQPAGQPRDMGEMLAEGLRATPGCLAADVASWESGKQSVVGWFESKEAVLAWYDSNLHQRLMTPMGGSNGEPLEFIPDDQGPIMVIATITPSDAPQVRGFPAPISQVSIEMFAPLPGGVSYNGRLAPDSFVVEHLRDLTPVPATP